MTLRFKRDNIFSDGGEMMNITLKAARVNAGFTQESAAKAIGVSKYTISSWERLSSTPNSKYIPMIEKAYGVCYNDLIFYPNKTL